MENSAKPDISQRLTGIFLIGAVGWAGWNYLSNGSKEAPDQNPSLTLAEYRDLSKEQRDAYVLAAISQLPNSKNDGAGFINCMGDFAFNKSGQLLFVDVLQWCERERIEEKAAFLEHFNELDAKDLSAMASVICNGFVRDQLRAPSTADFPLLDFVATRRGGNRWMIQSYVDAQNGFGATVRTHFLCDLQYHPPGQEADSRSWELLDLEIG
jgi:hypothetical protein